MKSAARVGFTICAGFLLFLGSVLAANKLQTVSSTPVPEFGFRPGPADMPGVMDQFNIRKIPELTPGKRRKDQPLPEGYAFSPDDVGNNLGSHRVPVIPASKLKPEPVAMTTPLVNREKPYAANVNEEEDDVTYVSDLQTETTLYGNYTNGAEKSSSLERGFFYEQNIRYNLFNTKQYDDSLSLTLDTTHSNDKREYADGFVLNQFAIDSKTPKSQLTFGHAFPEFSRYSINQQMLGFSGMQKFDNTSVKAFTGYKALEKNDLKNPRWVNGFRLEHAKDESFSIGLNAVSTSDLRDNPGSERDLPTLENRVFSLNVDLKPTENIFVFGEYAGSKTEYDRRNPLGDQSDRAYRTGVGYVLETLKLEGGVEEAGSSFFSPLGESPRDERAYYGHCFYDLNRYFGVRLSGRTSRDNLASYKVATIVRDQPEMTLTVRPSDYYKDLRFDFFYQPSHEYSDNVAILDRYKDVTWLEFNHRAGAFRYFANLSSIIDKDQITPLNDQEISRVDLKLTWEYDAFRQVYGLCSLEQLGYRVAGGQDKTSIVGIGGRSQFHEDLFLNLQYTRENDDVKTVLADSVHDRLNVSLAKEYNNLTRLTFELEGSDNRFENSGHGFSDLVARVRYLKSF